MITFKLDSSLTFPAKPGSSGMTTTTWETRNQEMIKNAGFCMRLALNFVPDLAARRMRSTRAWAIRFLTGPSCLVFDMLQQFLIDVNLSLLREELTRIGSLQQRDQDSKLTLHKAHCHAPI